MTDQCHQREKQGQIIFVPLEKSGGLHTKNSVVGTQAEQQSALYVVGIIDDGWGVPIAVVSTLCGCDAPSRRLLITREQMVSLFSLSVQK